VRIRRQVLGRQRRELVVGKRQSYVIRPPSAQFLTPLNGGTDPQMRSAVSVTHHSRTRGAQRFQRRNQPVTAGIYKDHRRFPFRAVSCREVCLLKADQPFGEPPQKPVMELGSHRHCVEISHAKKLQICRFRRALPDCKWAKFRVSQITRKRMTSTNH